MDNIEFLVLRNLLHNEDYLRKTIPFLKGDYFQDRNQKLVFEEISNFVTEYNQVPTKEVLTIETENRKDINGDEYKQIVELIDGLEEQASDFDWLVDTTEKWCRDRAIYLALLESISIADGGDQKKTPDAIHRFFQTHWQSVLITMWVMTIS